MTKEPTTGNEVRVGSMSDTDKIDALKEIYSKDYSEEEEGGKRKVDYMRGGIVIIVLALCMCGCVSVQEQKNASGNISDSQTGHEGAQIISINESGNLHEESGAESLPAIIAERLVTCHPSKLLLGHDELYLDWQEKLDSGEYMERFGNMSEYRNVKGLLYYSDQADQDITLENGHMYLQITRHNISEGAHLDFRSYRNDFGQRIATKEINASISVGNEQWAYTSGYNPFNNTAILFRRDNIFVIIGATRVGSYPTEDVEHYAVIVDRKIQENACG